MPEKLNPTGSGDMALGAFVFLGPGAHGGDPRRGVGRAPGCRELREKARELNEEIESYETDGAIEVT